MSSYLNLKSFILQLKYLSSKYKSQSLFCVISLINKQVIKPLLYTVPK